MGDGRLAVVVTTQKLLVSWQPSLHHPDEGVGLATVDIFSGYGVRARIRFRASLTIDWRDGELLTGSNPTV
jgi:hypothetical protein